MKYDSQKANFSLGALQCFGEKPKIAQKLEIPPHIKPDNVVQSCESLRLAGHTAPGYYMTSKPGSQHIQVTYCDMTLDASDARFQIDTLVRLPKNFVAFEAYRANDYSTTDTVIPYETFQVNHGGGMDLKTGVFTAPVSGVYVFLAHFWDNSATSGINVRFRKNGNKGYSSAYSSTSVKEQTTFMSLIVELVVGDTVDTYLSSGAIAGATSTLNDRFGGYLLYPK
jgi:hypothetical protein